MDTNTTKKRGSAIAGLPAEIEMDGIIYMKQITRK
jgi:hypothetical protein